RFEIILCGGGDVNETGEAQDAVPGGEVGLLLEHIMVFSSLSGVFDLPDLLPLRRVTDVFCFLLPNIPSRLIRPDRRTHQRERALNPRREQYRGEEPRIDK